MEEKTQLIAATQKKTKHREDLYKWKKPPSFG